MSSAFDGEHMNLSISQLLASLTQAKQSLKERYQALNKQITKTEQELNVLGMAPTARSDVEAMLRKWVDTAAAEFTRDFSGRLEIFARDSRKLADPRIVKDFVTLAGVSGDDAVRALNCVLCAAHGEAIYQAMKNSLDAIEWPVNPVTQAEQARRQAALEQKLQELRAERDVVEKEASAASIYH